MSEGVFKQRSLIHIFKNLGAKMISHLAKRVWESTPKFKYSRLIISLRNKVYISIWWQLISSTVKINSQSFNVLEISNSHFEWAIVNSADIASTLLSSSGIVRLPHKAKHTDLHPGTTSSIFSLSLFLYNQNILQEKQNKTPSHIYRYCNPLKFHIL